MKNATGDPDELRRRTSNISQQYQAMNTGYVHVHVAGAARGKTWFPALTDKRMC
jgi:hypothetical protein